MYSIPARWAPASVGATEANPRKTHSNTHTQCTYTQAHNALDEKWARIKPKGVGAERCALQFLCDEFQ